MDPLKSGDNLMVCRFIPANLYVEMELTSLESREIFLAAVFLCIDPFLAALSITDFARFNSWTILSCKFSATAALTSLTTFFTRVLMDLFRKRLTLF